MNLGLGERGLRYLVVVPDVLVQSHQTLRGSECTCRLLRVIGGHLEREDAEVWDADCLRNRRRLCPADTRI